MGIRGLTAKKALINSFDDQKDGLFMKKMVNCNFCNGAGYYVVHGREDTEEGCPYCAGNGKIEADECDECVLADECPGYYDGCFDAVNRKPLLDIDGRIRKHELIAHRLRNIKAMEEIIAGKSNEYSKYMHDSMFIQGVRMKLEVEKECLQELYDMENKNKLEFAS